MKISVHWLKKFIDLQENAETIADKLTAVGLEVEGIEKLDQVQGNLAGIVIGEVLSTTLHPNADRLKITSVDIGQQAPVPIVCGAANVGAGQKVVVATVGSTLYPITGESFTIKKAKIRGEVSEGMICAEDEIGLGTSHDGIMVLNTQLPNGTPAAEYFSLSSDTILEIGLTPNRADAASHLGVARDLKAIYQRDIHCPSVENFKVDNRDLPIKIRVENTAACPRYSGVTISGVRVKPSPEWLQGQLRAIGVAPINNVVDATNYVLHELGQPLHAFDADAIAGHKVVVRTLPAGTSFVTLDGKERKLQAEDLMICNAEKGMCIAGVFGGEKSGIRDNTQRIFLESAYFSPEYIRRTAQHHRLKTDASFRYERGTDPNITVYALKRAVLMIQELAGGMVSSDIIDLYPEPVQPFKVEVRYKNVDRLIGKKLEREEIKSILKLLDIQVLEATETGLSLSVPPYKVDVQREADVIEEILRIYGYDNIEVSPYLNADFLAGFPEIDGDVLRSKVSEMLVGNGFYEIITNSLTKPAYNQAYDASEPVVILNKLSEDLGEMRQNLLFTGLEVLAHNINHRQKNLKLFEFGTTYHKDGSKYLEERALAIYMTGQTHEDNWKEPAKPISFHHLSSIIRKIFNRFGMDDLEQKPLNESPFGYGLMLKDGAALLAKAGKVDKKLAAMAGVKEPVFFALIRWPYLLEKLRGTDTKDRLVYQEISRFPEVKRDLSLVLDSSVLFDDVEKVAKETSHHLVTGISVFDVYEGENIGVGKKAYALSFTLQDEQKTLTDDVIDKIMNRLMMVFEQKLGAVIRK